MKLILAEKPSVGMSIARVLGARERKDGYVEGNGVIVSWCFGHLAELADAKDYDPRYQKWSVDDLPILPHPWQYRVQADKKEAFERVAALMNDPRITSLVCATDAGREGELIFRLVYHLAGCTKPFERLWISSMEDSAIREGFENLKPGQDYDWLAASAEARLQADWLVGINATRLFTSLYHAPLSLGRVQTPTLAMLVEREARIAAFQSEKSYSVQLDLGDFLAENDNGTKGETEAIAETCAGKTANVTAVEEQDKTVNAPKLYDLTTLQRDANRLYGYTAQQTLDGAQRLYEKKLLTYPRTDSQYITKDMEEIALALVPLLVGAMPWAKGVSIEPDLKRAVNDAKVSDHHAILPTKQIAGCDLRKLDEIDSDLLELVSKRLLLSASPKHVYRRVVATLDCEGTGFTAKGKTVLQEGWKALEAQFKTDSEPQEGDEDAAISAVLPPMQEGQTFAVQSTAIVEHNSTPPKHFTEDTLLSAMETAGNDELDKSLDTEKKGIGTPATRAGIIEKLIASQLVERNKKQLLPTDKGVKLIAVAPEVMKSPKLTAQWENELTEIALGKRDVSAFESGIRDLVSQIMREKDKPLEKQRFAGMQNRQQVEREVIGKCPRCGANVYETKVNYRCSGEGCGFALWKDAHFFSDKKKVLTKTAAKSLLKTGNAKIKGFTSPKTGKKYDATVVMEDTGGKYVRFHLEFDNDAKKGSGDA